MNRIDHIAFNTSKNFHPVEKSMHTYKSSAIVLIIILICIFIIILLSQLLSSLPLQDFVLQLEGVQKWTLYKPLQELSREFNRSLSHEEIGEKILEVNLEV